MGADSQSTSSSLAVVGLCVCALTALTALIANFIREPLYLFDAHHVVFLFGASNLAFLCSALLLLARVLQHPAGGAGISLYATRTNLLAAVLRAAFSLSGGVFATSWLSRAEAVLSVVGLAALTLTLEPAVARAYPNFGRGAAPETFPMGKLLVALVLASLLGSFYQRQATDDAKRWLLLTSAIYIQAAAMLPQRELLLRTKRISAATSHAFFLLALGGLLRLLMWGVLVCEAETHILIMLGDFLHIGLLSDFVILYTKAMADRGLGGLLDGGDIDLQLHSNV